MINDFFYISYDDILSLEKYLNDKYQYSENDVNSTIKMLKTFEERNF